MFSPDDTRPSNADLFLLLLNNTSRVYRKEFESQISTSKIMAHRYETKTVYHDCMSPHSARTSVGSFHYPPAQRVNDQFVFRLSTIHVIFVCRPIRAPRSHRKISRMPKPVGPKLIEAKWCFSRHRTKSLRHLHSSPFH